MKTCFIYPCKKLIKRIKELAPPQKLSQKATLIYEDQVPNVALLLLDGQAHLNSDSQGDEVHIKKPCLLCFWHLMEGRESRTNITLFPGSAFSFLDIRGAQELIKFACIDAKIPKT